MNKIQGISFPRSGHKLLVIYLSRYFSRRLDACERLPDQFKAAGFVWCEHYRHCRQVPCPDPETSFQKYHDHDLKLKQNSAQYYLIQYRDPVPAIISHYKIQTEYFKRIEDTQKSWEGFWRNNIQYYEGFINKWVLAKPSPKRFLLRYEDLVTHPQRKMEEILRFFDPSLIIDIDWLGKVVHSEQIIENDFRSFKYYRARLEELKADLV